MSSYLPTKCFQIPLLVRYVASYLALPISPQFALLCRSYVTNLPDLRKNQELTDDYFEKIDSWRKCDNSHNCGRMPNSMPSFAPRLQYLSVPHEYPSHLGACALSTGFLNMLDYTAGVVPTGVVSDDDDFRLTSDTEWPVGYNLVLKKMREAAANSKGMPLGVQIVTPPYCEEECLALMKEVEALWKN
ncbi:hypothetical protein L596_005565 [Steinernema carpocapsae]|uniref:Amidase domain-containing protein n=1 Tax=Steinernema carpocapsae TaxID=34508 RepID=A0A4U8V0L6_STECR|nr:hypothetical protein L596_005565 [Steinernema carpocapsae]